MKKCIDKLAQLDLIEKELDQEIDILNFSIKEDYIEN